jgi:hypothetical protein
MRTFASLIDLSQSVSDFGARLPICNFECINICWYKIPPFFFVFLDDFHADYCYILDLLFFYCSFC